MLNDFSKNPQPGKFKDVLLANVPPWYLLWLIEQPFCRPDVKAYINSNMAVLLSEQKTANKNRNH